MRRLLGLVLAALLPAAALATPNTTTITWTQLAPNGSPATSGTVTAVLSAPGVAPDGAGSSAVAGRVTANIGVDGSVLLSLVPNDVITPAGTTYTFQVSVRTPVSGSSATVYVVATDPDPAGLSDLTMIPTVPGTATPIVHVREESTDLHSCNAVNFLGTAATASYNPITHACDVSVTGGSGGSGVPNATYVTRTPDVTLTNEQAISALPTGLLVGTTGTGVIVSYPGTGTTANAWVSSLDPSGTATLTQPNFSNLAGAATDAQVPNTITVDNATNSATAANVACSGCVTAAKVAADVATQAELDAHAAGSDHDSRYYTKAELNTSDGTPPDSGSNRVSWDNIVGMPAGFVDGSDDGAAGGISTVREADASPTVSAATVVEFDQSDGIVVADQGSGVARVSLLGIPDFAVSNTLTASIFAGSGSTTNAVDLASAEVAGVLPQADVDPLIARDSELPVAGVGISGTSTFAFAPDEMNSFTWGDNSAATNTFTFNVSGGGTDPTLAVSQAGFVTNAPVTVGGGINGTHGVILDDNTATLEDPAAGKTTLGFINSRLNIKDTGGNNYEVPNTNGGSYGDFSGTAGSFVLANSGVGAGSFTNANITVDAKGRLTAASNGSTSATSFIALTDTDTTTYAGHAGEAVVVNSTPNGLTTQAVQAATITSPQLNDFLVFNSSSVLVNLPGEVITETSPAAGHFPIFQGATGLANKALSGDVASVTGAGAVTLAAGIARDTTTRGKNANHITVGKTADYDFTTVQAAINSISGNTSTNPFVVEVGEGVFDEIVTLTKSYVALIGTSRGGSVIRNPSGNLNATLTIGDNSVLTEHVSVERLRVIQQDTAAPLPALAVGPLGVHATFLNWDNILVRDCDIEGKHDGLQIYGQTSAVATPGALKIVNNNISSAHDTLALKGNARVRTLSNMITADSGGIPPYIAAGSAWKTTGIHFNVTTGGATTDATTWDSESDEIFVKCTGASGGIALQRALSGIHIYGAAAGGTGSGNKIPVMRFNGTKIRIVSDYDFQASEIDNGIAGINLQGSLDVPDGRAVFHGLHIKVDQVNAGTTGQTPDVYGVRVNNAPSDGTDGTLRIFDSVIEGSNAASGKVAYALGTLSTDSFIKYGDVHSDLANSASGAITRVLEIGDTAPDDTAYDATTWNGVTTISPSKNAVRDKIELLAPLASPTLTGTPTTTTASADTNTTQIASTAFVVGQAGASTPIIDGTGAAGTSLKYSRQDHVHPTDTTRAPLASPTFTGDPLVPTASPGDNDTSAASTAFVSAAGAALDGTVLREADVGAGLSVTSGVINTNSDEGDFLKTGVTISCASSADRGKISTGSGAGPGALLSYCSTAGTTAHTVMNLAGNQTRTGVTTLTGGLAITTSQPTSTIGFAFSTTAPSSSSGFTFTSVQPTSTAGYYVDSGGVVTFEGTTADANETALGAIDPTADRTINLPDLDGTILVSNAMATGRSTAQTAAVTTVATVTVGASDASFEVSANVNVTTSTLHTFAVTCTYTDETNTSRVMTMGLNQLAGTQVVSITNATGAGPYESVVYRIRAKAGTAITIGTSGTFTTVTYNVEGFIKQT